MPCTLDQLADTYSGRRDPDGAWHWTGIKAPTEVIQRLGGSLHLPDAANVWHVILDDRHGRLTVEIHSDALTIPGFAREGRVHRRTFDCPTDQRPPIEVCRDQFDHITRCVLNNGARTWYVHAEARGWLPASRRQVALTLRNVGLSPKAVERAMCTMSAVPWRLGNHGLRSFDP